MKFDFSQLRWLLLVLYVLFILVGIYITIFSDKDGFITVAMVLPLILGTQFLFASSTSSINFCGNHKKRNIVLPAIVAALAFGVITGGFFLGIFELIEFKTTITLRVVIGLGCFSWLFWGIIFYLRYKNVEPDSATGKLLKWVLLGSLTEMVVLTPVYVITSSRGHCFAGLGTMIGLICGGCIAIWSFGPGIFLLFLRHYKKKKAVQENNIS